MKRFLKYWAASLALAVTLAHAQAWIVETPHEFISQGDFDGDGLLDAIVLDKESGAVRVAFQNSRQELIWSESFASGIAGATSLAVGKLSSASFDSIAVTSPNANRINKLNPGDALSGKSIKPSPIFPTGIGPNAIAAIDIGGAGNSAFSDLFVATAENPESRYALLRNTGLTTSVIGEDELLRALSSPNVFEANSGKPLWLGALFRAPRLGFTDQFQAFELSTGALVTRLNVNSPVTGADFVAHRFDSTNPFAQILFYRPGDSDLIKFQIQQDNLNFVLGGSNRFRLSGRLQLLQPLPTSNGARLLAFFGSDASNLTDVSIYDFDGVKAPQAVSSFSGNFSGALFLGDGFVALLNANDAGKSISHQVLRPSGQTYTLGHAANLPATHRFSGAANALLFDVEPFVNTNARPRQLLHHVDWTTSLVLSPSVRVTGQEFIGTSNGLGGSVVADFGAPVSGAAAGLVNQYHPAISVFSGRDAVGTVDGEIRISPAGGHFGEAQNVRLSVIGSGSWQIYYRLGSSQAWTPTAGNIRLISAATLEAYARRNLDGMPTAIAHGTFTFNQSIGQLDSDNDGIPDFVEQARGLDPLAGADTDGDGFTDLEELARGTNPNLKSSKPAANAELRNAFNRLVTPRPPNASGVAVRPLANVSLSAYTLGSSLLGIAGTSVLNGTGNTNPAAFFENLTPDAGARFIVETTPPHFGVSGSLFTRIGRELIGLVPIPPTNTFVVPYTFGNGSLAVEAAEWIAAASNTVKNTQNPTVPGLLTFENTVVAALFEAHYAKILRARGSNDASHATLFSFRPGDADRRIITAGDLRNLGLYSSPTAPGYRQETVFNYLDGYVRSNSTVRTFVDLAREIWRISAAENNSHEGVYALPFDELRRLLGGENPSSAYMAFDSVRTNAAAAQSQVAKLLLGVPPRPQTNLNLVVVKSNDEIHLETSTGVPVQLWRFDGSPFVFPPNIELLAGTRVRLFGHADLTAPVGESAFEVITISILGVPMPSPTDADGNLLVDSWEELFFGGTGFDAFADYDGDGYSNLQEMIDGTQPDDALMTPPGPPVQIQPPSLVLNTEGAQLKFEFTWPASYLQRFQSRLVSSPAITGPYTPISTPAWVPGPNGTQELRLPKSGDLAQFYLLTLELLQ